MTLKELINKTASDLFEAGYTIASQVAEKDAEVTRRIQEAKGECGCASVSNERVEMIEFDVYEEQSRDTWIMKAKGGAIANIFNQEYA